MPGDPGPGPDLDLRLVRYFAAVAEHGNFGRAAQTLHVAQPSVSRQVRRLEEQLGARLLDRSSRGSMLTAAGRAFLPRAQGLLAAAEQAVGVARSSAHPDAITVGFTGNLIVTAAVLELRKGNPDALVAMRHLAWDEPHEALVNHRVDAAVARMPFPTQGLVVTVLYREPIVVVLPATHPLAGRKAVSLDDIADEPMPRLADDLWDAFWRVDPRPGGRKAPDGPLVRDVEEKLELIAGGQAVALAPAHGHAGPLRDDLIAVPVEGAAPSRVVLATREGDRSPLVVAFRHSARRNLASES